MSYILQGLKSAWDSVGRKKQSQVQPKVPLVMSPAQAAMGGAVATASHRLKETREPEGEVSLRGAEAMLDNPQIENNVSPIIVIDYLFCGYDNSLSCVHRLITSHCLLVERLP